jgi:alkylhydroperoxidase family enzyme
LGEGQAEIMTWIRTIPLSEADDELRRAAEGQRSLYPIEYATPVHPAEGGGAQIVESHSLIPKALYHAFATFGALMSPELPLTRRQHEMITTVVSVTNRCVY